MKDERSEELSPNTVIKTFPMKNSKRVAFNGYEANLTQVVVEETPDDKVQLHFVGRKKETRTNYVEFSPEDWKAFKREVRKQ